MTDTILDAELRREVYRQRFASYLVNEYVKAGAQDMARSVPRLLSDFDYPNINKSELNRLAAAVRAEMTVKQRTIWDSITSELEELGMHEAEAMQELYSDFTSAALTMPTQQSLVSAMSAGTMTLVSGERVQAGVWSRFVRENNTATNRLISGVIEIGFQEGRTLQEVTREIRGSYNRATKTYQGGLLQGKATQWAETLARTGTSHYSAMSRDRFAQANKDVLTQRILIATLDNRTTLICRARHLQRWDITDDNYPRLPFHYNERSGYVFSVEGEDVLEGTITSVGGKAKDPDAYIERPRYRGKRDSEIYKPEQVSADVTQSEWLRRQPPAFVRSALGETRAKLFLDGKIGIDSFVDMQGRPLTLSELKRTTAGERAFRRAGIDQP